jgi:hypothetical protein
MSTATIRRFDVCNGDADGLCAVRQWRLHEPAAATLISGGKRDIELLGRVPPDSADEVLVCDLSMRRNRAALDALLAAGAVVRYFDHHAPGEVPIHARLDAHIDESATTCTCLIVDDLLKGASRHWALVGAYGDNLTARADAMARDAGLTPLQALQLRQLGEAINYNAYDESTHAGGVDAAQLYRLLSCWADPICIIGHEPIFTALHRRRIEDLNHALDLKPLQAGESAVAWLLPATEWAHRVIGTFGNERAQADPARAQAVLLQLKPSGYRVSLRAPIATPAGAAALCRRFGGDGRAGAAGIDCLAQDRLAVFLQALDTTSWTVDASRRGALT